MASGPAWARTMPRMSLLWWSETSPSVATPDLRPRGGAGERGVGAVGAEEAEAGAVVEGGEGDGLGAQLDPGQAVQIRRRGGGVQDHDAGAGGGQAPRLR